MFLLRRTVLQSMLKRSCVQFRAATELSRPRQASTMGKEPVNIMRLKRQNDQFADAAHHAHDLSVANVNAKWFSDDFNKSNAVELTAQTKEFEAKETSIIERFKVGAKDQIVQELEAANATVAALRKERLRGKLQSERRSHEAELNALGLAFNKHRD